MGIRPTILPWLVLGAGITGGVVALLMQWWTNAVDYPLNISGKPLFSLPANIPVTFELIILFSALTAFFGVLVLNGLPRFNNPLLEKERFLRATTDRFFICHRRQRSGVRCAPRARAVAGGRSHVGRRGARPRRTGQDSAGVPPGRHRGAVPGADSSAVDRQGPAHEIGHAPHASRAGHGLPAQVQAAGRDAACFANGQTMRLPVPGTIAYGDLRDDDHFYRGLVGEDFATTLPAQLQPVTMALMTRGRERFKIYCAPCHGLAGEGDGITSERALAREDSPGWVKPLSLHSQGVREQPVGKIFNTITNGIRTMPRTRRRFRRGIGGRLSSTSWRCNAARTRCWTTCRRTSVSSWKCAISRSDTRSATSAWPGRWYHDSVRCLAERTAMHLRQQNHLGEQESKTLSGSVAPVSRILIVVGVVLLALALVFGFMRGDGLAYFFHAYLVSFCFYLSISLGGLFFVALQHASRAGWSVAVRRVAEIMAANTLVMAVLFLPILLPLLLGNTALYEWLDPAAGRRATTCWPARAAT